MVLDAVTHVKQFVDVFIGVYVLVIFLYVLASWMRLPYSLNPLQRFLHDVCDPYLRLWRRILPFSSGRSTSRRSPAYQPLVRPNVPDQSREFVGASYLATGMLALVAIAIGYGMVESQNNGNGSALNVMWTWMLSGLLPCLVVPLALRWYWGRMNGWGFAAGCLTGLVPSLTQLASNFAPAGSLIGSIPANYYTYTTLAVSTIACIAVSLVTPRIEDEVSAGFYAKVRPFGLWKDEEFMARSRGLPMASSLSFRLVVLNVLIGLVATFSLYMAPVYFFGHWPMDAAICSAIFVICSVILYFTWYKTLPTD